LKKIIINRITSIPSTLQIVWDNVTDFTHFVPLHRKHFKSWDLIYEQNNMKVFHYQSRVLYPFNFAKNYIGVRVVNPQNYSFTQMYYCPDEGRSFNGFLQLQLVEKEDRIEIHNKLIFYIKGILSYFPKFFAWLVNYRAHKMWLEDKEIIQERNQIGSFDNSTCLPPIKSCHQEVINTMAEYQKLFTPSSDDFYEEFLVKEDSLPDNQK
jgi:hypothetical protein